MIGGSPIGFPPIASLPVARMARVGGGSAAQVGGLNAIDIANLLVQVQIEKSKFDDIFRKQNIIRKRETDIAVAVYLLNNS